MSLSIENVADTIRQTKADLQDKQDTLSQAYVDMTASIQAEVDEIKALKAQGKSIIPELDYQDVIHNRVNEEQKNLIRKRGCVVIRNTFPAAQAQEWSERIGAYLTDNGYYDTPDKGIDKYFSSLQAGKPQIFSVYWSKPQMEARQSENLAQARRFLNRLWTYQGSDGVAVFDPDRECTYADRTRRREPGDNSLGLKPHIDGGSVERWVERKGFWGVYRHLLAGNWQNYDPFDAAYRTETEEIPSPAVCSMFRTYQGWTALSPQGPGDGTLQLVPIARAMGWMYLRALQPDVPEDDLCAAIAGRALLCSPQWHSLLLEALTSIPQMHPGDSIWWHPDVIHAVEDEHKGKGYSNVIYIGAAPYCEKNVKYLAKQAQAFTKGESAPDFAAEHYELDYKNRATIADLSELGKKQMGLMPW
ncbi:YbiU family protein [Thiofilum flexile]|uniref:YbiU family protein n=1 Tax=Thiofilum flexile TaxID=125627 RepID=UPI00037BB99F|nr:YbiU family protein [Thiofilum flexile]